MRSRGSGTPPNRFLGYELGIYQLFYFYVSADYHPYVRWISPLHMYRHTYTYMYENPLIPPLTRNFARIPNLSSKVGVLPADYLKIQLLTLTRQCHPRSQPHTEGIIPTATISQDLHETLQNVRIARALTYILRDR